jgi:hypothetical protein
MNANIPTTFITKERLAALELLQENIPKLIEKAISDYKKDRLKMLHEKDKQNPAAVNARVKRYNERNKDKINARRLMKKNERNISSIVIPLTTLQNETLAGDEFVVTF